MNYPNMFVTVTLGRRNEAGDWIHTDDAEVSGIATGCQQIVITPPADKSRPGPYVLTHLQSGYFLLGGFPTIEEAREGALRLARIFPIENWNAMGELSRAWNRTRVNELYKHISPEDKLWMAQHGGPRLK